MTTGIQIETVGTKIANMLPEALISFNVKNDRFHEF